LWEGGGKGRNPFVSTNLEKNHLGCNFGPFLYWELGSREKNYKNSKGGGGGGPVHGKNKQQPSLLPKFPVGKQTFRDGGERKGTIWVGSKIREWEINIIFFPFWGPSKNTKKNGPKRTQKTTRGFFHGAEPPKNWAGPKKKKN